MRRLGSFFLLGVEGLLLQFTRFAGCLHLRAILCQSNERISHVEHGCILHLLQARASIALWLSDARSYDACAARLRIGSVRSTPTM